MTGGPWIRVLDELERGIEAGKCHTCGCFHGYVDALDGGDVAAAGPPPTLAERVAVARAALRPARYDCLGCETCFPADGSAALEQAVPGLAAGLCASAPVRERDGWPPLPGEYVVLDPRARVAVCCLTSRELYEQLSADPPPGAAIVGLLFTENLGIERIVRNVLASPDIAGLVVVGADSARRIGHQAGASLVALLERGVDGDGRIPGAPGKRPWLKNITAEDVDAFRRRLTVTTAIDEVDPDRVARLIARLSASLPEAGQGLDGAPAAASANAVGVTEVPGLELDPAGWFVVDPDRRSGRIRVEHYSNQGTLNLALIGEDPAALVAAAVARELLTRLDHAAYLGRELDRARRAIDEGLPYRQDAAPDNGPTPPPEPERAPQPPSTDACCGDGCGCAPRGSDETTGETDGEPGRSKSPSRR